MERPLLLADRHRGVDPDDEDDRGRGPRAGAGRARGGRGGGVGRRRAGGAAARRPRDRGLATPRRQAGGVAANKIDRSRTSRWRAEFHSSGSGSRCRSRRRRGSAPGTCSTSSSATLREQPTPGRRDALGSRDRAPERRQDVAPQPVSRAGARHRLGGGGHDARRGRRRRSRALAARYVFVDTAGIRRAAKPDGLGRARHRAEVAACGRARGRCARVCDAERGLTDQDLRIAELAMRSAARQLLVLNKWDLTDDDDPVDLEHERAHVRNKLRLRPTRADPRSAQTGRNAHPPADRGPQTLADRAPQPDPDAAAQQAPSPTSSPTARRRRSADTG